MSSASYDVIAAEVHRKALENVTREMAITLMRTSGSTVVTEGKDFSTCVMDLDAEPIGFAAYVLIHLSSAVMGGRLIADLTRGHEVRPGDGWIINDPQKGGQAHQADVSIVMPTFHRDRHIGWAFSNMHVLDIGGGGVSGYAPGAHEIFEEGLLFPPIQIIRDGLIDPSWEAFIASNVRVSDLVLNDIRSMIAANNTAERKLTQIVDEYGLERHEEYCRISKDLTEQLMRERISAIPDGVYEVRDWAEFDGHEGPDRLLELYLEMEIAGSDMHLRFTGAPQIDAFVNSSYGAMLGQCLSVIMTTLAYGDLPINGGFLRPIHLDVGEPGTIVNSLPPAPCSNAHAETGMRAIKMVKDALSQALSLSGDPVLRGRVAGVGHDCFPGLALFGQNQHGRSTVMFYVDTSTGQGGGAQTVHDGMDAYGPTCAVAGGISDVETHEADDPVLFHWRRLSENSGGPGQRRGGQSLEQAFTVRYADSVAGPLFNACAEVPPRGFGGGYPGAASLHYSIRDTNVEALMAGGRLPLPATLEGDERLGRSKQSRAVLQRGDVLVVRSGGGSGLGDPLLRDAAAIATDLENRYLTVDHVAAVYGVVLTGGAVDEAATATRREEIRAARIGRTPTAALAAPASIGVPVVVDRTGDPAWCCGYCGGHIAPVEENWREGAVVLRETPIRERFDEIGMYVRRREEAPGIVTREYYCGACAGVLSVDVSTDANEPYRAPRLTVAEGAVV